MTPRQRRNGNRGMAFAAPTPRETPPENGLISIYLSPRRVSGVIHWVSPGGDALYCNSKIPAGRFHAQPEARGPTCGRCIMIESNKQDKVEGDSKHG